MPVSVPIYYSHKSPFRTQPTGAAAAARPSSAPSTAKAPKSAINAPFAYSEDEDSQQRLSPAHDHNRTVLRDGGLRRRTEPQVGSAAKPQSPPAGPQLHQQHTGIPTTVGPLRRTHATTTAPATATTAVRRPPPLETPILLEEDNSPAGLVGVGVGTRAPPATDLRTQALPRSSRLSLPTGFANAAARTTPAAEQTPVLIADMTTPAEPEMRSGDPVARLRGKLADIITPIQARWRGSQGTLLCTALA